MWTRLRWLKNLSYSLQVNEFINFDNQRDVLDWMRTPWKIPCWRGVKEFSRFGQSCAETRELTSMTNTSCRCYPSRPKSTTCAFDRVCVFVVAQSVQPQLAAQQSEQQPEGGRFVLDTILPGYQWAPQWVSARTPTVHWGPISGKAVGGPWDQTTVQSSIQQSHGAETRQTLHVGVCSWR